MFKRTVTLVALLLAIVAPAALADSGTPTTAAPTRADFQQHLDKLHDRIQKATARFKERCENGKADSAKCKAAAEKGLDRLKKISGRIDDRIAKIKARCDAGTSTSTSTSTSTQPVPKACAHAADVVEKLRTIQGEVKELARRLQAYLDNPPAATGDTGGTGTGTTGTSTTGLESLGGLAADLAAAQAAAGN